MNNELYAFTLTVVAGLATGIGSLIAFFPGSDNRKFMSVSLGFSAGVMIYVSMIEIFVEAKEALSNLFGEKTGTLVTNLAFFGGMLIIGLIDKLVPNDVNPHNVEYPASHIPGDSNTFEKQKLMRSGYFIALAIAIHNFPEGLATFISALHAPSIAIPIVAAIAIHNIPVGIAISVPIFHATGSRKKAFLYSFASGLTEPAGALIGYLLLLPFMSDAVFGVLFAAVAGIMVFISFDELLPSARTYGEHHLSIYGLVAGMVVMAFSLWLFV